MVQKPIMEEGEPLSSKQSHLSYTSEAVLARNTVRLFSSDKSIASLCKGRSNCTLVWLTVYASTDRSLS